ncbi:hypothetical protein ACWC5F_19035 [Streptomyces sp. NPDC001272]|uniref:hypothetical protein n=2 Tax=unclassified Streptomyces TaxID=2593676 RepID=UPI0033331B78
MISPDGRRRTDALEPMGAPCPVRDSDSGHCKNRARHKSAMDRRTRTPAARPSAPGQSRRAPLKDAQTCLATGRETPAGAPFTPDHPSHLLPSHLALIDAALALDEELDRAEGRAG